MENKPLMACGHVANAVTYDGKPCCVICGCYTVALTECDLAGRKAKCSCCGKVVDSKESLPFFEYRPEKEYDSFYCGCWGWD